METIGTVEEIWRYPVKSMAGELLSSCSVGALGITGDRGWAVRDEKAGEIRGAKKLPQLMKCSARYVEEPAGGAVPAVDITFPDGTRTRAGDQQTEARLSNLLGRPVTLWPLQPPDQRDFYRRSAPDNPDMITELRQIFGRREDEPLPDLTTFPREIMQFTSPLGTYFDAFPIHLITTASLAELSRLNPEADFDVRRFRPNFLIKSNERVSGFDETKWSGRTLRVGEMQLKVAMPCVRCVMPTLDQDNLPKDPSVLRTIVRHAEQNVGLYATVTHPGRIKAGDTIAME
ncbi:MAG: MOSC domain-containing protein [Candidatus Binataceae bacterium]